MKLIFLGGADEVGASCTLIEIGGKHILVDAGIRISPKSSKGIDNSQLPDLKPISDVGGPDYIFVTHAHTDHTGALPLISEQYPNVPVFMTRPTHALTRTLQLDAQRIMKSRDEEEGELPLFDMVAVESLFKSVELVEFDQKIKLGEKLQATYFVSGHIAGAGSIIFDSDDGTLVMSGDVSLSPQRTVKSFERPKIKADALVIESTYGGKLHAERRAEEIRLINKLKEITERGGKVILPAFALGRAQEIIQIILAHRDELSVPVYVDGMVRSVCNAYNQFRDLLPEKTVKMAGEEHLFFRKNVHAIKNAAHRSEVATSGEPCVVIASSGMLTGGASVFYAKHFAPTPENAIILTGYQDEESPGRFLQNIQKQRAEGLEPIVRLGKEEAKVRCEVSTYSLSAHADEQELVNVAKALGAEDVFLVHGDHGARKSLSQALRKRQVAVHLPQIGTVRELMYKARSWVLEPIGTKIGLNVENPHANIDLEKIWLHLKDYIGSYFSLKELSRIWIGDESLEGTLKKAMDTTLNYYFSINWRDKKSFRVRNADQVAISKQQHAIQKLYGKTLVNSLCVIRNVNQQVRLAVITKIDYPFFKAKVLGTKGERFPYDALMWRIGEWTSDSEGVYPQLKAIVEQAESLTDILMPYPKRLALANTGEPFKPEDLLPNPLPEGVSHNVAMTAILFALAKDRAELTADGLIKTQHAFETTDMDQNSARNVALTLFPEDARLRKVGMNVAAKILILSFDFPAVTQKKYSEIITTLEQTTGWRVNIKDSINQQQLIAVVSSVLPEGLSLLGTPSIFMDKRQLQIELSSEPENTDFLKAYNDITGFELVLKEAKSNTSNNASQPVTPVTAGERMEINQAYQYIRQQIDDERLYKTSLKIGTIVLSFISPQIADTYAELIAEMSNTTGYALSVHPHANQHQILTKLNQFAQGHNLQVTKSSVHSDKGIVKVKLDPQPSDAILVELQADFIAYTGYSLELA